jgi:predicted nucleic-acid-binding protein
VIALDTNVLVRFLVEDDAEQLDRARALVGRIVAGGDSCFVSDVVLCELVWVLQSSYRIPRGPIADHLQALLRARHFSFSSTDRLARALRAFRAGRGDFADFLIREHARAQGCDGVATLDGDLVKEEGFVAP